MPNRKRQKNAKWFIKLRGSYLPNSWQGWLSYIPYSLFLLGSLLFVYKHHYDIWQSIFWIVPNWVAAAIAMTWVARQKS